MPLLQHEALIFLLFLSLVGVVEVVPIGSLDELSYDENGKLATHLLVYSDGKCADLIEDHLVGIDAYGYEFQPVMGGAKRAFFQDREGEEIGGVLQSPPSSVEDCDAICIERGVDKSLVTSAMPYHHFNQEDQRSPLFKEWFIKNCSFVELCVINYHSRDAPLNTYWFNTNIGGGKWVLRSPIYYGERESRCMGTYIGHRFKFEDNRTKETVLEVTVEFATTIAVGKPPPYNVVSQNYYTRATEKTLKNEWKRHNRIQRTFSAVGFRKGRLPDDIFASMGAFYYNNQNNRVLEEWTGKGVFVNWWETDVYFVQIPILLKSKWAERLKLLVEAWVGEELEETSMYGLRRYESGARLLAHVDRHSTHAASLIVNVAQENVAEPWMVDIYDHADRLHQITMDPGDIIYYESAKCLHARSVPLKGEGAYYVNLFTHYRPVGDEHWYQKDNPVGTPDPLIDIGECQLLTTDAGHHNVDADAGDSDAGVSYTRVNGNDDIVVMCDNPQIGPYLSPSMFTPKSGEDLFEWWRSVPSPESEQTEAENVNYHRSEL